MKVSIITVCYNAADTIADALYSIHMQTHPDIECIIIDGASNDSTLEIARRVLPKAHIISEPDRGIYDAMNKGIQHASGDIVGILNADDFYTDSQVLEKVVTVLEDSTIDACYSDLVYVGQMKKDHVVRYWKSSQYYAGLFEKGWVPPHPTFFVRRSIYQRYGFFDLNFKIAADFELMLRFVEVNCIKTAYIPHVMVKMRLGGTTNRNWKNILIQNLEIRRAFRIHNMSSSLIRFIMHKGLSRFLQFMQRPQ